MALPLISAQKTSAKRSKRKSKKNTANNNSRPASLLKSGRSKKRLSNYRKK